MSTATIKICACHDEEVPLLWTFAFPGAEYWCPACGYTNGMFGAGQEVEVTMPLKRLKVQWKKRSEEFLDAMSTFSCSELEWEGKRTKPSELPQEEKDRCKKVIDNWKYEL